MTGRLSNVFVASWQLISLLIRLGVYFHWVHVLLADTYTSYIGGVLWEPLSGICSRTHQREAEAVAEIVEYRHGPGVGGGGARHRIGKGGGSLRWVWETRGSRAFLKKILGREGPAAESKQKYWPTYPPCPSKRRRRSKKKRRLGGPRKWRYTKPQKLSILRISRNACLATIRLHFTS